MWLLKPWMLGAFTALIWTLPALAGGPTLLPNKGQWPEEVHFQADLGGAYTFLHNEGLTVLLAGEDFYNDLHAFHHGQSGPATGMMHAVKLRMPGASLNGKYEMRGKSGAPNHYFLGNDRNRWARDVRGCRGVSYKEAYPGIDLRYELNEGRFKYEFVVQPGADPSVLGVEIEGARTVRIVNEEIVIETSVGSFKELAPFAFQRGEDGKILKVPCHYVLEGNVVRYDFPEGYNPELTLVIDPELSFSTLIGAVSSNFGFTASYDVEGNLYSGAIVFGPQYPTTPGGFQVTFGGANVDMAITKFSADGTQLLYSTFLGGSDNEAPHSIVVSTDGEAYIFGTTGSANFPTTTNAYQQNHLGGLNLLTTVGFPFAFGTDMFVTKLSADGGTLLGSTLIGGSSNDGLSQNTPFNFNYGDLFRGEIVIDAEGNAYVASVTRSADFPIVGGYSNTFSPPLSGVVFKLSSDLSTLMWSTFTGGDNAESATSVQLASDNSVYFSGGTLSSNLATPGAYQAVPQGDSDGYVGHISADGSTLLHCTYTGTSDFDLNYFVQLDTEGNVYVVGQTYGNYPVSPGIYSNANSGQFIHKLSPDLGTSIWSTVVGTGQGNVDISPSAFLVSDCGQIYLAGWGGVINASSGGTTVGLPITADAYQTTTDGNDFYIMVLGADASELVYATFFGGNQSQEHVDGGTSRFDKNGTVYQAVCAGCGGNSDFPAQPGVWSSQNLSTNCNLGVFKFSLSAVKSEAAIEAPENICTGTEINFLNLSVDANVYLWDFGDGATSTATNPSHSYGAPGTYEVWLRAENDGGCLSPDSTLLLIEVLEQAVVSIAEVPNICPGESVELQASGADTYAWSPAEFLSNPTAANPVFSGPSSTTLSVTGTGVCGSSTASVDVVVGSTAIEVSDAVAICPGQSAVISATGAANFVWSPEEGLNNPNVANPSASPAATTLYTVTALTGDGCDAVASVLVTVLPPPPQLESEPVYVVCNGIPADISVSGAESYTWSPEEGLSSSDVPNPSALPLATTTYTVTGTNPCGSTSLSVEVLVNSINVSIQADSAVCKGQTFMLSATGGAAYRWQPIELFNDHTLAQPVATIVRPTLLQVTGFDEAGCFSTAEQWIFPYPQPQLFAGRDKVIRFGDEVELEGQSTLPIVWNSSPYLSCLFCNRPIAKPPSDAIFYASVMSTDGCMATDSVNVFVRGNLYVPNAFTPDGDGRNERFKAEGIDIVKFKMLIWNRWGQMVHESDDIDAGWQGNMLNSDFFCPAGVYPYYIKAREAQGEEFEMRGTVTLIR